MRVTNTKRAYIPDKCPKCRQAEAPKITEPLTTYAGLSPLLSGYYMHWRIYRNKRDEFWRMPMWVGSCGRCTMNTMIFDSSPLLSRLRKPRDRSITIPFASTP